MKYWDVVEGKEGIKEIPWEEIENFEKSTKKISINFKNGEKLFFDNDPIVKHFSEAINYYNDCQYFKAIENFSDTILISKKFPTNNNIKIRTFSYKYRGFCYLILNEFVNALCDFKAIRQLYPCRMEEIAHYSWELFVVWRKYDLVFEFSDLFLDINAFNHLALTYRSFSYLKRNEIEKALKDIHLAIFFGRKEHRAYFVLALIYEAQNKYKESISSITKAISLSKTKKVFDKYFSYRAKIFIKMKNYFNYFRDLARLIIFIPITYQIEIRSADRSFKKKFSILLHLEDFFQIISLCRRRFKSDRIKSKNDHVIDVLREVVMEKAVVKNKLEKYRNIPLSNVTIFINILN